MTEKVFDVFGIGNPLMDILVKVDDSHLAEMDLKKGTMHLVDAGDVEKARKRFEQSVRLSPGGAESNVAAAVVNLGGKAVICGKVGKDETGDIYEEIITKEGIKSNLARCHVSKTGQVVCLITADGERTFMTHLGAAVNLQKDEVFGEDLKKSKILFLSGYMLEAENLKESSIYAMEMAKENNVMVAVDLADPSLIKRNLDDLRMIIGKYADIAFFNEDEAEAFTGKKEEEALHEIAKMVDIAVVKLGPDGSLIKKGDNIFRIGIDKVDAVDTTGAGDSYAGGFLFGIARGYDMEKCGKIGSLISKLVVQQMGARLGKDLAKEIESL